MSSALSAAPPVISIIPQHTPPSSFGDGILQSEPSSPRESIPPRIASLVSSTPGSGVDPSISHRRPNSMNPEAKSRIAHQSHTRTPSSPINNTFSSSNSTASISIPPKPTTRLIGKAQAYVSSSPLSTGPPVTVPTRSISKPAQSITVQLQEKKAKEKSPLSPTLLVVSKATTTSKAPLKLKPAKTDTAPLNPKTRTPAKRIPTNHKPPSIVTDCMAGISNFTINLNAPSGVVSPASSNPQSPSEFRPPQSIIATLNQAHVRKQQEAQKTALAQQRKQPERFVATIKVVVNAHMIFALKILEETGFLLSVPDLRLRVMNKFRRMSMAIPDEFDLVWDGGNGSQVVLKNDEEIQKALRASVNNKLTLRCIFQ
ncbi:hypothetical protein BGZ91_003172 [Linnemannia elongata]|nr:hypothetical protein BGZ91_003172 [Linnemannia elongata]